MDPVWPQAILLDLDDTILAFSDSAEPCWRRICEKYAPLTGSITSAELLATVNTVRSWFWKDPERHRRGRLNLDEARREIVVEAFSRLQVRALDLAKDMADSYTSEREETVQPFPGAIDALHRLRRRRRYLSLITNGRGEDQRRKITRFNLASFFDYILIEGEFGVGKPDVRVYHHVLGHFGVAAEVTWMVGDNLEWDVAAPQRVGIRGIWVDYAGTGLPEGSVVQPDRIIQGLAELIPE